MTILRLLQYAKAYSPILCIPSGIVMLVSFLQPSNIECAMFFRLFGSITLLRFLQFVNAPHSKEVTLSGITTSVRPVEAKAPQPIEVTLPGMVILLIPSQSENALGPIVVRLSGNITLLRLLHRPNAPLPI